MFSETAIVSVAFATFVPMVYKPVKNAFINLLDKHTADTIRNINHARDMYEQSKRMHEEITKKFNEAEAIAQSIISHANEEAISIIADAQAEIEKITAKKTELALSRINQQEKHIVESLRVSIIERALNNVNELIAHELDANAQLTLIDNSIKRIARKMVN